MAFHWKMWKSFSWKKIVFSTKIEFVWTLFCVRRCPFRETMDEAAIKPSTDFKGNKLKFDLTTTFLSTRRNSWPSVARRRYVTRRAASLSRSTMTKTTTPQTSITSNSCRRKVRVATEERSILTFEQMTFGQTSFDLFGRRRRVKFFDRTRLTSARTPARDDAIRTPFAGTKKLQIPGLFFLYFCPCWLKLTVNKCSMKAVGEWWIWTRILCCQK